MIRSLLALLLAAGVAGADDLALLRRAVEADAARPRIGRQSIEVYPTEAAVRSEVEVAFDGAGHARREHRSGPSAGLVVISEGRYEWLRGPGATAWVRTISSRAGDVDLRAGQLDRLASNYTISISRGGEVAGRATQRLDLTPRREGNPSRRLWVDAATGLTLRCEIRNRAGELVQRWSYASLRYASPDPATVRLPADAERYTGAAPGSLEQVASQAELERRLGHPVLRPRSLPAGYVASGWFVRACREGGFTPVTTFSDGLNAVTLMETRGRGRGRGRRWRGGRCQIQPSRLQVVVRVGVDGHEAVIVGDHAPAGLEAMARSLE